MAFDKYGRWIDYIRISLTDHCNLRCKYCMPDDQSFRKDFEIMTDDEIIRLTHLFSSIGFNKVRLTGGEPTIRPGVVNLVKRIAGVPGITTLTMTTNGILFAQLAAQLVQAGLQRVNFSLDTLDLEKYQHLTGRNALPDVIQGIRAAEEHAMLPIKINVVVIKGFNEDDVIELAKLTMEKSWQVRFIEMMPLGSINELQINQLVTSEEVRELIQQRLGKLEMLNEGHLDGEARLYRIDKAQGELGFISSISDPFCHTCNRMRLTSDGRLRLCLLREGEVDILSPLREGASDVHLRQMLIDAIWNKPWGNGLADGLIPLNRHMSEIGG